MINSGKIELEVGLVHLINCLIKTDWYAHVHPAIRSNKLKRDIQKENEKWTLFNGCLCTGLSKNKIGIIYFHLAMMMEKCEG